MIIIKPEQWEEPIEGRHHGQRPKQDKKTRVGMLFQRHRFSISSSVKREIWLSVHYQAYHPWVIICQAEAKIFLDLYIDAKCGTPNKYAI